MEDKSSRTLDQIAYDPKPGDRVRIASPDGTREFRVRDVRYSDVICDIDGVGDQHVALAEWYAMCLNTPGGTARVEVVSD